jgi:uncharacterized OsmC-like protein
MQAPIKERYKADPAAAIITLKAKGSIDNENITCKVETGRALALAGLHPATGGSGLELCSGDMLLEALVACAGVTVSAVATAMGVKLRGGRVVAQGHWDARGTLGVDREAPVGLTDIALTFELDTDADAATVQRLVEMSERFCVIYQTLRAPPRLTVTHRTAVGA